MSTVSAPPTTAGEFGKRPLDYVRTLMRLERRSVWLVVIFSVAIGLLTLATPVAVQTLVNFVAFGGLTQPLIVLGILLLVFLSTQAVIRCLNSYVAELLQRRVFARAVAELGDRLPRVNREAYDSGFGAGSVNKFFDVLTVQKVGSKLLLDAIGVLLQTSIGLIVLAFYHPYLLAFDLVVVLAIAVILFPLGRGAVRTALRESTAKYAVADALEDVANQPVAFQQVDSNDFALRRADHLASEYLDARRSHFRIVFRQIAGAFALQALAGTALLTIGGLLVIKNQLTLGQLVAAELIVALVLDSFSKFGRKLESVYDLVAASHKIGLLMDTPREREDGHALESRTEPASLRLHDVRYAYEGGHESIGPVSTDVAPGSITAIEGRRGSGKSTLAELLYGQRDPGNGHIEVDGQDLRSLSLASMRSQVCLVQPGQLLRGTVEQNVQFGRPEVDPPAVRRALELVGVMDDVRRLPKGVSTPLIPNGRPLSSGSVDLVLLARAIAGQPRLLILDDICDDLDHESRERVLKALGEMRDKTTTVILTRGGWDDPNLDRRVRIGKQFDQGFGDADSASEDDSERRAG